MNSDLIEMFGDAMNDIKHILAEIRTMPLPPFPVYENANKSAAYVSYRMKDYDSVAFYLSESHGGGIRSKLSLTINPDVKPIDECLSLNSKYVTQEYQGLMERLAEMPSEWTLVQVTRNVKPKETILPRPAERPVDVGELFITRYPCGKKYSHVKPLTVMVNKPRCDLGTKNLFEILIKSLEDTNNRNIKDHSAIRNLRDSASQSIKKISEEIHTMWIKHWIYMFMGNYIDEKLSSEVYRVIDSVIEEENLKICDRARMILYQIANAVTQLTETELNLALEEVDCSAEDRNKFEFAIAAYRLKGPQLVLKKRHSVLLILDEHLECLPWEMMPCLKRHPVSRVSSVHIVHSLYIKHKGSIKNGLLEIKDKGCYMLNPDKTLTNAEKRMSSFLMDRYINWPGLRGEEPTAEKFTSFLQQYDILLYCGHGNGTQYLHSLDLDKLDLRCIPLLFGCSSAKHTDRGGRPNFGGASYGYLKAGCPNIIGMLWNVTSLDADNLARAMLNVWLPGNPINLHNKWPKEFVDQNDYIPERELLRTLAIARKSSKSFFNSAALIARGIPVIMTE